MPSFWLVRCLHLVQLCCKLPKAKLFCFFCKIKVSLCVYAKVTYYILNNQGSVRAFPLVSQFPPSPLPSPLSPLSQQESTSATVRAQTPTEGPVNGCHYRISVSMHVFMCMCVFVFVCVCVSMYAYVWTINEPHLPRPTCYVKYNTTQAGHFDHIQQRFHSSPFPTNNPHLIQWKNSPCNRWIGVNILYTINNICMTFLNPPASDLVLWLNLNLIQVCNRLDLPVYWTLVPHAIDKV